MKKTLKLVTGLTLVLVLIFAMAGCVEKDHSNDSSKITPQITPVATPVPQKTAEPTEKPTVKPTVKPTAKPTAKHSHHKINEDILNGSYGQVVKKIDLNEFQVNDPEGGIYGSAVVEATAVDIEHTTKVVTYARKIDETNYEEPVSDLPKDAGTYKAIITLRADANYEFNDKSREKSFDSTDFVITKKEINVTCPRYKGKIYDGHNLDKNNFEVGEISGAIGEETPTIIIDKVIGKDSADITNANASGVSVEVTYVLADEDVNNNYKINVAHSLYNISGCAISKARLNVAVPTYRVKTYDGQDIDAGDFTKGTVTGAINEETPIVEITSVSAHGDANIKNATEGVSVDVTYGLTDADVNKNYEILSSDAIQIVENCKIKKITLSMSAANYNVKTYDGQSIDEEDFTVGAILSGKVGEELPVVEITNVAPIVEGDDITNANSEGVSVDVTYGLTDVDVNKNYEILSFDETQTVENCVINKSMLTLNMDVSNFNGKFYDGNEINKSDFTIGIIESGKVGEEKPVIEIVRVDAHEGADITNANLEGVSVDVTHALTNADVNKNYEIVLRDVTQTVENCVIAKATLHVVAPKYSVKIEDGTPINAGDFTLGTVTGGINEETPVIEIIKVAGHEGADITSANSEGVSVDVTYALTDDSAGANINRNYKIFDDDKTQTVDGCLINES